MDVNQSTILGPFLCKASSNSMGVWFSFGTIKTAQKRIAIEYWRKDAPSLISKIVLLDPQGTYQISQGVLTDLLPDTTYQYRVLINEVPQFFGLAEEDFQFTTLSETEAPEFLAMSCHGIEAFEQKHPEKKDSTWAMWDKVLEALKQRPKCRIGILGGDQVYMDDTFGEDLSKFNPELGDINKKDVFNAYAKYWNDSRYRKIMARLPCLLMWDDHDIIDGWGSRNEQYDSPETQKWAKYGTMQYEAFEQMQGCRNTGTLNKSESYTFFNQYGNTGILGLDLRKKRTKISEEKYQMLSPKQRQDIELWLEGLTNHNNLRNLIILSPVTLARMGGKLEFFLGSLSNFLWDLGRFFSYEKSRKRSYTWALVTLFFYSVLYMNSEVLRGIPQAVLSAVCLLLILLVNCKSLTKYFPNKSDNLIYAILGLTALLAIYAVYSLCGANATFELLWPETLAYFQRDCKAWLIGSGLTILNFAVLGFANSKTYAEKSNKWSKPYNMIQPFFKKNLKYIFAVTMVGLVLANWQRGLPKHDIYTVVICAITALLTFMFFVLTLLEISGTLDLVAGLNDDVLDGWSSHEHSDDLKWFLNDVIQKAKDKGLNVSVLCGDIHTAGLSKISFNKDNKQEFYQVTTSPISYFTMPALVEKITTSTEESIIAESRKTDTPEVCRVNNIFYRSERNFVIISPNADSLVVDYYFEDLGKPLSLTI